MTHTTIRPSIALISLLAAAGCQKATAPPEAAAPVKARSQSLGASERSFTAFESGQVRPLALSDDGKFLYAVNTPDNRLEIFRTSPQGLKPAGSVAVGLEPVAV